jgi:hypothetical protein
MHILNLARTLEALVTLESFVADGFGGSAVEFEFEFEFKFKFEFECVVGLDGLSDGRDVLE